MEKITKHAISARTHVEKYSVAKGKTFLSQQSAQVIRKKLTEAYLAVNSLLDTSWEGVPAKGKAVRSDEDKFNETLGMDIASLRAKRSATDRLIRKTRSALKALTNLAGELTGVQVDLVGEVLGYDDKLSEIAQ